MQEQNGRPECPLCSGVREMWRRGPTTYFSNHSVRLVVCRIIVSRLGEWISLSSLVQTLPTSSDGCTAL